MQEEIISSNNNIISSSAKIASVMEQFTTNIQIEHDYIKMNQNEAYASATLIDNSHINVTI